MNTIEEAMLIDILDLLFKKACEQSESDKKDSQDCKKQGSATSKNSLLDDKVQEMSLQIEHIHLGIKLLMSSIEGCLKKISTLNEDVRKLKNG